MDQQDDGTTAKVLRGALAGLVAGAVASFAMDRFQAVAAGLLPADDDDDDGGDDKGEDQKPATQKAANSVARLVTGHDVPAADGPLAGQAMHYALGIGLGVAYGIAAEFRPSVTSGFGTAFGIGTATVLDEAAVPALGLGAMPWQSGLPITLYGYASHLVFGTATELVRRQVAATLKA